MNAIKILSPLLLTLLLAGPSMAQPPHERQTERWEKIESYKIAYLTKELDLSSREAQKFWPVYNQFTEKIREVKQNGHRLEREARANLDQMSDKELEHFADERVKAKIAEAELEKAFHNELKKILPAKKTARLYLAEEDFRRELVKRLRDTPRPVHPRR